MDVKTHAGPSPPSSCAVANIRAWTPSAEFSSTHDHVQPHSADFRCYAGVHDLLRLAGRLYYHLQTNWHLPSIREGLLSRFAVPVLWYWYTEPGPQDPLLTMMLSVTGRPPVLNNLPVQLNLRHQRMLDRSYVYRIYHLCAPNSHFNQLKVLGDTRTPFAVRHPSLDAERHRTEYAVR